MGDGSPGSPYKSQRWILPASHFRPYMGPRKPALILGLHKSEKYKSFKLAAIGTRRRLLHELEKYESFKLGPTGSRRQSLLQREAVDDNHCCEPEGAVDDQSSSSEPENYSLLPNPACDWHLF